MPEDLLMYSLNPHSKIITEKFESSEQAVTPWKGGGTRFNIEDPMEESE